MTKRFQGLRALEHQGEALSPDQFDSVMAQFAGTQPMAPEKTNLPVRAPGRLEKR